MAGKVKRRKGSEMDKLHGYVLLVIAKKVTPSTVWHFSTGNDESVCGKGAGADSVGYIDTEDALSCKGVCQACARYTAKHGDYEGWDSENNRRFLSITWPKNNTTPKRQSKMPKATPDDTDCHFM